MNKNAYRKPRFTGGLGNVSQFIERDAYRNQNVTPLTTESLPLPDNRGRVDVQGLNELGFVKGAMGTEAFQVTTVPIIEIAVGCLQAVLHRAFGLTEVVFENTDNLKRMLRVAGPQKIQYPRCSLSLDSAAPKSESFFSKTMALHGISIRRPGMAQNVHDTVRFMPVQLAFRLTYIYQDYNDAIKLTQSIMQMAGMRGLACVVKLHNGIDHQMLLMTDGNVTPGKVEFDNSVEVGAGTLEVTFTIDTQTMTIREGTLSAAPTVLFGDAADEAAEDSNTLKPLDPKPEVNPVDETIAEMLNQLP